MNSIEAHQNDAYVCSHLHRAEREPTIDAILIHRACPSTCNDIIGSRPRLPLVSSAPTACSVRHNFSGMLHSARCCSAALTFHLFLSRYAVGMPRNITYLLAAWPIYMRKSSSFDGYWSRRGRMRGHKVAGCTEMRDPKLFTQFLAKYNIFLLSRVYRYNPYAL